jgi:Na+:H+ antiporter, NhaA family
MSTAADLPPGASRTARRIATRLLRPLERFLQVEAASGIVLLVAGAVALGWASSPWRWAYHALWATEVTLGLGPWLAHVSLQLVVNDALMAIFFLVVGLEIRREIHDGELSDLRRAALPLVAAVGGMILPAVIYTSISGGGAAGRGWGVPMATDIAFAVGILALLGSRVPPALRVLLLALAIIDDIGAIIVIAIFYSAGIDARGLAIALVGIAGILALQRIGVRQVAAYIVPAIAIWAGFLAAGIHPTIAGVVVGMLTPARAWFGTERFLETAQHDLGRIAQTSRAVETTSQDLVEPMASLRRAEREARSPVERLETALHPWVAFGVMPIFALANAGIDLRELDLGASPRVAAGIAVALIAGKLAGVLLATALAVKLRVAAFPRGVGWRGIVVVGAVAGIGFTMALFIAELAFSAQPALHGLAKLGVLGASVIAASLTLVLGRWLLPASPAPAAVAAR